MCIQAYNSSSPSSGGSQGMPNRAHSSLFSLKPSKRVMDLLPITRKLPYVKRTAMVQPFLLRCGLPTSTGELKTAFFEITIVPPENPQMNPRKKKLPTRPHSRFRMLLITSLFVGLSLIIGYGGGKAVVIVAPMLSPPFFSLFPRSFLMQMKEEKLRTKKKKKLATVARQFCIQDKVEFFVSEILCI